MKPYYADHLVTLWHGDCIEVLTTLPDASVDSVVTDPPYGIGFMGRKWDKWGAGEFQSWCEQWSRECLRVLKPGGHMLAFGGTRTWHRLTVAVEDAGFEIRDSIAWMYGSGFPKSLDVSKALDKMAGAERGRKDLQHRKRVSDSIHASGFGAGTWAPQDDTPVTLDAQRWQGWGTALKPAFEPIVVARKPLAGTVAANVLAHGTGALNIAACRIGEEKRSSGFRRADRLTQTPLGISARWARAPIAGAGPPTSSSTRRRRPSWTAASTTWAGRPGSSTSPRPTRASGPASGV